MQPQDKPGGFGLFGFDRAQDRPGNLFGLFGFDNPPASRRGLLGTWLQRIASHTRASGLVLESLRLPSANYGSDQTHYRPAAASSLARSTSAFI